MIKKIRSLSKFWYIIGIFAITAVLLGVAAYNLNTHKAYANSLSFNPTDDAYISQAAASTNYGTSSALINDNTSGSVKKTFLKFTVADVPAGATINNVTLRMNATNSSGATMNAKGSSNTSWSESSITWNNAPSYDSAVISNGDQTVTTGPINFNVTSYVTGNGTWTIVLTQSNAVETDWSSKEGSTAPELIVDYTPPASTSPVTINPSDDAYVSQAAPTTNYGTSSALLNDNTSSNIKRTFLKFTIPTLPQGAVITSTTLRMNATNSSGATVNAKGSSNTSWSESSLTWNNAPSYNSTVISNGNKTVVAGPIDFDLTSYASTSGTWSIVLTQSNTTQTDWSSKEGSTAPQLIVAFVIPPNTSPTTFTPTDDAYISQASSSTNYGTSSALLNDNSSGVVKKSFIKFKIDNLPLHARITNATLRLTATNSSGATANVKKVTNNQWGESSITWANAPSYDSAVLANGNQTVTAGPIDFNVTSYASTSGTWSFVITQSNAVQTDWSSKEGATAPQLIVTFTTVPDYGHDAVLVAVGDIACDPADADYNNGIGQNNHCAQAATATAAANINPDRVILLGDNQYECGGLSAYQTSFNAQWGQFLSIISPATGNHERNASGGTDCDSTSKALGYRSYFQNSYSPPPVDPNTGTWYSYDLPNNWHVVVIDSDCSRSPNPCTAGGAQDTWLRSDLEAASASAKHILAYWHHPRFSEGDHGDDTRQGIWWNHLYNAHADLVLNGHEHNYQEFGPVNPSGTSDTTNGIRQIIAGTGGKNHYSSTLTSSASASLTQKESTTHGVLKLVLHSSSYDWQYVPIAGQSTNMASGSASTHQ